MTFYTFWNHSQEKAQQSAAYEQRLSPQGDIVNADDISNQNTWGVANLSYQKELGGSYHVMFGGDLIGCYSYTVFDGINTYTFDYGLCGRTAMLSARVSL